MCNEILGIVVQRKMDAPTVILTALKCYFLFSDLLRKPARKLCFISLSWFRVIAWIFVATSQHFLEN